MKLRIILVGILTMPLAACGAAQTVRLTLNSVPEGAAIIQNGSVIGVTPTFVQYNSAAAAVLKSGQCFTAAPMTARWTSGATSDLSATLCPQNGYSQQYTFLRPADVAGADVDAQIATANQMARATRAAAQAAADAATEAANLNMIGAGIGNAAATYFQSAPPPPPKPVTCTTSPYLGQLKTVCQ